MKRIYEKPAMKAISLQSEEHVAETCWGGHAGAQNLTWAYYGADHKLNGADDPEGWFSFKINASDCRKATDSNVVITYQGTANDDFLENGEPNPNHIGNDSEQQARLRTQFFSEVNVSNAGSPWKGEKTVTPIISSK